MTKNSTYIDIIRYYMSLYVDFFHSPKGLNNGDNMSQYARVNLIYTPPYTRNKILVSCSIFYNYSL